MEKKDWLTKNFTESRGHLKAVAYRMLGSTGEAEDAVQEAWARLTRSEAEKIDNLHGWLTTVVARVCLDMLRSRQSRREEPLDKAIHEISSGESGNPESSYMIANSVGPALLVVLDLLTPAERIAFVLHDLFELSFAEIAPIIDHSEESARQLASRARRRVKGAGNPEADLERQREVVMAFLAASRNGDFAALIKLLHPDAVLRADATAVKVAEANKAKGAPQFKSEIQGAKNVADTMNGKAAGARLALVDGRYSAAWAPGGKPVVVFCFSVEDGKVSAIDVVMDARKLNEIKVEITDAENKE